MKPQFLLLWASARGFSCGGCCVFSEWVIQESTCTHDKVQSLCSEVTHLHFCICLVSQVNPVIDWERTTQGWEYQEIRFTWRLVTIPINPRCQPFFFHMISILLLWANYLACVLFLCTATAAKLLQSCPTLQSHGQQPTKLPRFWDSPGKNPGMGCHFLHQCMRVKSEIEVAQSCPSLNPHGLWPTRLLCLWDRCFSETPLLFPWSSGYQQFDLWFLFLF